MGNQRVEMIEANHVLAAMQELGWKPGEKPPALAAIQAQLRKMFSNGGDTNRLSRLREEAILHAGPAEGYGSEPTPAEAVEISQLPEALDQRLADCAAAVGSSLSSLHHDLASYLGTYRAGTDRDTATRIDAAVKTADDRIAAAEYEVNVALAACDDSAARINELTTALAEAQAAAAAAAGKVEAMAVELTAVRSQLITAEDEVEVTRGTAATATGKADAVERELVARTARITELEAEFTVAQTALATAAGRLEVVERELAARDERLYSLNEQVVALTAATAKANGRAEAVENELDARTVTLAEVEKSFITAMTASAAAASRAEALDAEASRLRERIKVLEDNRQSLAPAKKAAGARQPGPAGKPEKRSDAGGEL